MMRKLLPTGMVFAVLLLAGAAARCADLTLRVDAREVVRKHVHTDMTLAVRPGALTLVFPKWIPGEHGPTGPLETITGLTIRANGATLAWRREPLDMYAISLSVPRGVTQLQIALDSGLAVEGGQFSTGPTSSAQLAILPWNEFVLFPKGRDARGAAERRLAPELFAREERLPRGPPETPQDPRTVLVGRTEGQR